MAVLNLKNVNSERSLDGASLMPSEVAEVYLEMVTLLEEYAPLWYTEELHDRAVAGLQTLKALSGMPSALGSRSSR
jgi:hypothetical protein